MKKIICLILVIGSPVFAANIKFPFKKGMLYLNNQFRYGISEKLDKTHYHIVKHMGYGIVDHGIFETRTNFTSTGYFNAMMLYVGTTRVPMQNGFEENANLFVEYVGPFHSCVIDKRRGYCPDKPSHGKSKKKR
jgi:hypothetical protein